ncbi:MAG TPA: YidC/Oxa1 family membrane protein insertase [Terriglobales bacterium]|nr:YidC/Oxa1 family membrane protein insertase [Terriglobales bacterium]
MWWAVFGNTLSVGLSSIYHFLAAYPLVAAIGAYGLAIVILTVIVRLLLAPLFHLQLRLSRRSMEQQKKIAPELAELRKKYKNDPQKQQQEMMALYREHGINPLGGLSGCLPALLQFPILTALYYVFYSNAKNHTFTDHFLFVPHLNDTPSAHALIPGLPIPTLVYLIIPLLAAGTTFVQSRMMQQPLSAVPTEQEQQTQQMTRTMQVMMPLMIAYFAIVTPAGLGLYWLVSNTVAIVQQYFVTGWGGLRRQPALSTATANGAAPPKSVAPAPKAAPANPSRPPTATTKPATSTADGRSNAASRPPTRAQKRRKARR